MDEGVSMCVFVWGGETNMMLTSTSTPFCDFDSMKNGFNCWCTSLILLEYLLRRFDIVWISDNANYYIHIKWMTIHFLMVLRINKALNILEESFSWVIV